PNSGLFLCFLFLSWPVDSFNRDQKTSRNRTDHSPTVEFAVTSRQQHLSEFERNSRNCEQVADLLKRKTGGSGKEKSSSRRGRRDQHARRACSPGNQRSENRSQRSEGAEDKVRLRGTRKVRADL